MRLDLALVARGLARSRTHASARIADGHVRVNGAVVLPRRKVSGYDSAKSYFKAGCYVNANGGTGCRSSLETLSFGG